MELRYAHRWDVSPREAIAIQKELSVHVDRTEGVAPLRRVAGVDVGFEDGGRTVRAAVAVLSYPELQLVEYQIARLPTAFPYVPGLLSFRECPAALKALKQLAILPDLLLCDGQGIAHPRRFGIACHLGVLTDIPTVGVAKSRLIGEHDALPAAKGCWVPLHDSGETIGAVLRTRRAVRPVYVSPGHRVSLPYAVDFVLACTTRYRLPETTRWADGLASGKAAFVQQLETASA